MDSIICAIIAAFASIIVAELSIKKAVQEKELINAKLQQAVEDRLTQLEKANEQNAMVVEKLNSIENTIIGIQKDIQYLKEKNK